MGSDPLGFLVLFGLGVREFSMPAPLIPRLKAFLAGLDSREAETIALHALDLGESDQIREFLCNEVSRITSYNVCYTKLLRPTLSSRATNRF